LMHLFLLYFLFARSDAALPQALRQEQHHSLREQEV
jgi:hypothetical protein